MDGKQWMPVVYGSLGTNDDECTVEVNGPKMTVREEGEPVVTVSLPAHLRLCRLVDAPAPAAWGPPMAQPDAEGWWAFKGEFCISALTSAVDVETIHLFEADDLDEETLGLYNGTFRKLLVSPWEVTP